MTARPGTVTIGIPTHNRLPLLMQALESVLAQTFQDIQVVVSDDASTDGTAHYLSQIADPRVLMLYQSTNLGLAANYQACLEASTSEFFLLLNDDDTLLPTAIEKLRHAFLHPPANVPTGSVGVVWCPFTNYNSEGRQLWSIRSAPSVEASIDLIAGLFDGTRGPICSAVMMRTSGALAVGGYEARYYELCESSTWGKTALSREFAVCVDEPLMRYLVHAKSSTTGQSGSRHWQQIVRLQVDDFVHLLQSQGELQAAERLRCSGNHLLANITASVMMRWVGRPGWVADCARELWRSRRIMLTPFALKRLLRDGWKLTRLHHLHSRTSRQASTVHPSLLPSGDSTP